MLHMGKNAIAFVCIVIAILSSGCIGNNPKDSVMTYGVSCPANLSGIFTAPIMNIEYMEALTPLGNVVPPGHTLPVDHIYFHSYPMNGSDQRVPIYSPADGTIVQIMTETTYAETGKEDSYAIEIVICRGVSIEIAGYRDLAPEIKNIMNNDNGDCKDNNKFYDDYLHNITSCNYRTNYQIKAGTLTGWAGNTNFDDNIEIWAFNYNSYTVPNLDYGWYSPDDSYPHSFCFFDLYSGQMKEQYYSKFGTLGDVSKTEDKEQRIKNAINFTPRTIEPRCGAIMQDVQGTVQGNWFYGSKSESSDCTKTMALIHNNFDPTIGSISVGGTISDFGVILFKPLHSGLINREFSEVRADGNVYCYTNYRDIDMPRKGLDGKLLVSLVNDHELQIEHQDGTCNSSESFVNQFTYHR